MKLGLGLAIGAGLAFFCACSSTKTMTYVAPSCEGIQAFFERDLASYQDSLDEAARLYQVEQWMMEMADPKASQERLSKTFSVLQEKTYDKAILEKTRGLAASVSGISDESCLAQKSLKRTLSVLEATIVTNPEVIRLEKENQDKQDAMIAKSNAFRMEVAGEKEPISKALYGKKLASLKSRAEREALYRRYNAARTKKWDEWGFRDLVKSRNKEGTAAGFANYVEYRFHRNSLNLENYRSNLQVLKTELAPKVRAALKELGKRHKISTVEAWDVPFLREESSSGEINTWLKPLRAESVLDLAREFYRPLGIDIDSYKFMMDLFPRAGKNTHAFAMSVVFPRVDANYQLLAEPKMDIRFCANLKQPVKWDDVDTVIHELAHAIHAAEVRQPLAPFRGTDSVSTEAVAMLTERMASSSEYFENVFPAATGVRASAMRPALKKMLQGFRLAQAFVLMRQSFFSDFEYEVYRNPDADFGVLWAKLHKEWWGVDVVPAEGGWDVEHFLMAPVYVQNYAIGILMVEQIYESILKEFKTSYRSKELGDKIRKTYFAPGMQYDYLELTERFTGSPLSAKAALKLLK